MITLIRIRIVFAQFRTWDWPKPFVCLVNWLLVKALNALIQAFVIIWAYIKIKVFERSNNKTVVFLHKIIRLFHLLNFIVNFYILSLVTKTFVELLLGDRLGTSSPLGYFTLWSKWTCLLNLNNWLKCPFFKKIKLFLDVDAFNALLNNIQLWYHQVSDLFKSVSSLIFKRSIHQVLCKRIAWIR